MPATVVTITIAEVDAARVIKALCRRAGVEETPANAKAALIAIVRELVIQEGHREAVIQPPELT